MDEFAHAQTIQENIETMKATFRPRIWQDFETLLKLALKVVSTEYDAREQAIAELESFLR